MAWTRSWARMRRLATMQEGLSHPSARECRRGSPAVERHRQDPHRRGHHRHRRGGVRHNRAGRGRPGDDRPPHGAQTDRRGPPGLGVLIDLVSWDAARGATRFSTSGIDLALHDLVGKILGVPVLHAAGRLPARESARRDRGAAGHAGEDGRAQLRVLPAGDSRDQGEGRLGPGAGRRVHRGDPGEARPRHQPPGRRQLRLHPQRGEDLLQAGGGIRRRAGAARTAAGDARSGGIPGAAERHRVPHRGGRERVQPVHGAD